MNVDEVRPDNSHHRLVDSMNESFLEGEHVAVRVNNILTTAIVAAWPQQQPAGEGLNQQYHVRISDADATEVRRQFEIFKMLWVPVGVRRTAAVAVDAAVVHDVGQRPAGIDRDPVAQVVSRRG